MLAYKILRILTTEVGPKMELLDHDRSSWVNRHKINKIKYEADGPNCANEGDELAPKNSFKR